jgi:hypothetical protein
MIIYENFFNTLNTGELEVDEPGYKFFTSLADILRTYGNTFEETLSTIKGITTLIW